jgi:hypothetical protein
MRVSFALLGVGGLLVLAGVWKTVVWLMKRPNRYARPMGGAAAMRGGLPSNRLGIALICLGAASFMAGIFWLIE